MNGLECCDMQKCKDVVCQDVANLFYLMHDNGKRAYEHLPMAIRRDIQARVIKAAELLALPDDAKSLERIRRYSGFEMDPAVKNLWREIC